MNEKRVVLLNLGLSENERECNRMIYEWNCAFDIRLPQVIMTDGDEAIQCSISTLLYAGEILHLLCVFHLFDQNPKKHVHSALLSVNGRTAWPQFRSELEKRRQAGTEQLLEGLLKDLIKKWFQNKEGCQIAITYLTDYIWSKRRQWASVYFKQKLTLGDSYNQCAESRNKVLKCFPNSVNLSELVKRIRFPFNRQGDIVKTSMEEPAFQIAPLGSQSSTFSKTISQICLDEGYSRFCCKEFNFQLHSSFTLTATEHSYELSWHSTSVMIKGKLYPTYCTVRTGTTSASINFHHSPKCDNESNVQVEMNCEFLYPFRMRIPCKHIICICIIVDQKAIHSHHSENLIRDMLSLFMDHIFNY